MTDEIIGGKDKEQIQGQWHEDFLERMRLAKERHRQAFVPMDLEQKASRWLQDWAVRFSKGEGRLSEVYDLTWRDLGEDSDEPVFLIGHPEQKRPNVPWGRRIDEPDGTITYVDGVSPLPDAEFMAILARGWRRILKG